MKLHRLLFYLLVLLLPTQLGRHFWPYWSYLFGLRIDYLSPTIYLTDLLVLGILVSWWVEKIKNQKSKIKNSIKNPKRLLALFTITIFLFVNCLLAQNREVAFLKFFKIIELIFLGYYVAKERFKLADICLPLSLAVLYSCLIAVCQFFKQSSLDGIFWWLGERTLNSTSYGVAKIIWRGRIFLRPYGTFSHPNSLAGFLLVGLVLTFPYFFKKNKIFSIVYLLFSVFVLMISFSRTVWFSGIFICLLSGALFFLYPPSRKTSSVLRQAQDGERSRTISSWMSSLRSRSRCFGGVGNAKNFPLRRDFAPDEAWGEDTPGVSPRELHQKNGRKSFFIFLSGIFFLLLLSFFAKNFSEEESIYRRVELNNLAMQMTRQSPIFGVGLNNFIPQLVKINKNFGLIYWLQPVHNIFLLVASETGIIGLFLFLFFLKKIFLCLSVRKNKENLLLLISVLIIILTGMTDHYWLTLQQNQLLMTIIFSFFF